MFNTTINDNSKNTGFFNNNLKNEVNITTKKGLFKTKVTVSSSKEIKRKKENDRMLDLNKTYKGVFISITNKKRNKKKPSLFNKKKEGINMFNYTYTKTNGIINTNGNTRINTPRKKIFLKNNNAKDEVNVTIKKGLFKTKVTVSSSLFNKKKEGINMNKNLVKVLVAGVAVGVVVAGAVVITKKVKARKARKAEEVKDENINEVVEEAEVETNEEEVVEEVEETTEEKVTEEKAEEAETETNEEEVVEEVEETTEETEEEKATDEKVSDTKVDEAKTEKVDVDSIRESIKESETTKETINVKPNRKSGKEKTKEKDEREFKKADRIRKANRAKRYKKDKKRADKKMREYKNK